METKQKTLAEENRIIEQRASSLKSIVGLGLSIEDCRRFVSGVLNEAAELYAGQTKQSEKTHCDENPVEFMRDKINEYFHDWRKSQTDSTIIEIDGNTLGDITFKAELETKKKFPWIRYEQSSPVSLEVEKVAESFATENNKKYNDDCPNEWRENTWSDAKDGFIDGAKWQSQQPASIAFLSEDEIDRICELRFSADEDDKMFKLGIEVAQTELRKRVIDPGEYDEWKIANGYHWRTNGAGLNKSWYREPIMETLGNPDTFNCSTQELLQIYINSKTK